MSSLKYQLKALLPRLSLEANKIQNSEVKRRLYLIKAVCESKKDIKKTCEARGVSTDVFYKFGKRLLAIGNLTALETQSRAPVRKWNKTQKRVEKRIVALREQFPFLGPERLSRELKKRFNIKCAPSTIGAVLKRFGLITKAYKQRLTKKHLKRYRRSFPGYMQLDIKYVPYLIEGQQFYQFSAIDHHSSWRCIRLYPNRTLDTTLRFLAELHREVPFAIMQIQTDNATEFTDKFSCKGGLRETGFHAFDQWCKERDIEHKLIPVGEKEINGKVENSHKFDDREFYSQYEFTSFIELRERIKEYNHIWNEERETKALGWKTPNRVVEESYPRALAYLNIIKERFSQPAVKLQRHLTESGYILLPPPPKRPKKPTAVSRYLKYLDWEQKKGLKAYLPMPTIFQIFSMDGIQVLKPGTSAAASMIDLLPVSCWEFEEGCGLFKF